MAKHTTVSGDGIASRAADDVAAVDGNDASGDGTSVLRVDNNASANVYVIIDHGVVSTRQGSHGIVGTRLGPIEAGSRGIYILPSSATSRGAGRFIVLSNAGKPLHNTALVPIKRGHLYIYTLRGGFGGSSVEWYPYGKVPANKQL